MQDAKTVLEVLRERGRRGLPLTQLYRQMFSRNMYLLAYGNIYSNQGAMTPGACGETADGMSEAVIDEITASDRDAWTGTVWFIEGDISDCHGSADHEILMQILAEKIGDQRFLRLIRNMPEAGYLEDREHRQTLSGCPQGGVVSPVLSNIYLHKLDEFVEGELIGQHTRGERRAPNPEYQDVKTRLRSARQRGDRAAARDLKRQLRAFPAGDPTDPGCRRLLYCRHADDHLLGFTGPKAEAEQIKAELARFLRETLALDLNPDKTLISHARTQPARFPGHDIIVRHCNTKITRGLRSANGKAALRVPPDVVRAQCARYRCRGKPWHRSRLLNLPDYDIVRIYGAEYRGIVNYYLPAQDVSRLGVLCRNALTSMLKTLAARHKSTVTKMAARFTAKVTTADGPRTCFEARIRREGEKDLAARFGGMPLSQDRRAVITDPAPVLATTPRKELTCRLRKRWRELCEHSATVAVHQIAGLASPGRPGPGQPAWAALMAKMRRKTLIACAPCHDRIHANPVAHAA